LGCDRRARAAADGLTLTLLSRSRRSRDDHARATRMRSEVVDDEVGLPVSASVSEAIAGLELSAFNFHC